MTKLKAKRKHKTKNKITRNSNPKTLSSFDGLVNHLETRHILTETLMHFAENKCRNLNSEAECNSNSNAGYVQGNGVATGQEWQQEHEPLLTEPEMN